MSITTPTATAVGARSSGPPPGRAEAPPGFSAALTDAAQTWTALAEGQTQTPQEDPAASIPADVQDAPAQTVAAETAPSAQPAADAPAAEPALDALLSELAAVLTSEAPATPVATPAAGALTTAPVAEEGVAAPAVALPAAEDLIAAPAGAPKPPVAAAPAALPAAAAPAAAATAEAATPVAAPGSEALAGVTAPAPAEAKPAATTAPVAAQTAAPVAAAASAQASLGQQAGGEQQPGSQQQAQPDAVVAAAPVANAAAPAPAPAPTTAAAPSLALPTVQTPTPGAQSAAIEALVQLAKQRGHAGARIALAPEELGGIRITLQLGTEGLTARLIADRPEAAAALQRAGSDLRASLEAQGIDLASLETSFAGDTGDQRESRAGERSADGNGSGRRGGEPAGDGTILHLTLEERPSAQPLAAGRTIDLHA